LTGTFLALGNSLSGDPASPQNLYTGNVYGNPSVPGGGASGGTNAQNIQRSDPSDNPTLQAAISGLPSCSITQLPGGGWLLFYISTQNAILIKSDLTGYYRVSITGISFQTMFQNYVSCCVGVDFAGYLYILQYTGAPTNPQFVQMWTSAQPLIINVMISIPELLQSSGIACRTITSNMLKVGGG
jgi:hypothetical protein